MGGGCQPLAGREQVLNVYLFSVVRPPRSAFTLLVHTVTSAAGPLWPPVPWGGIHTFQHLSLPPACLRQSALPLEALVFFHIVFFREEGSRRDGNISDEGGALLSCLLHVPHRD